MERNVQIIMKNAIQKIAGVILSITLAFSFTGCNLIAVTNEYNIEQVPETAFNNTIIRNAADGYTDKITVLPYEDSVTGLLTKADVKSAILIDDTNKECLYSLSGYDRIFPASMTKVMSGILIMDALNEGVIQLEDKITLSHNIPLDPDAARLDLKMGDTISVKDLIYGYLIRSLNDCGIVLAEMISGSEAAFVEAMNQKAYTLGATNTHFVNCHGLHDENHYTTPYDLYLFFRAFADYDFVKEIDAITEYTLAYTNAEGKEVTLLIKSTNGFMSGEYNLDSRFELGAWKSGTTKAAGNCLVMQVFSNNHTYYLVVSGASEREVLYKSMMKMLSTIK